MGLPQFLTESEKESSKVPEEFLSLAEKVYLVKGPVGAALYDFRERKVWAVPPLVLAILEAATNGLTFEAAVKQSLGKDVRPTALKTVRQFVQNHPALEFSPVVPPRPTSPPLSRTVQPTWLMFEITSACNLSCCHCYLPATRGAVNHTEPTLSTRRWVELMEEGRRVGFGALGLTGGEPAVHPELQWLLRLAHGLGYQPIALFTNLTLLSDELLAMISEIGAEVHTSLYSLDAQTHDTITGEPGSFERVIEGLRRILAAGVETFVGIPVMEQNLATVDQTIGFLADMGIALDHIKTDCTLPIGRGANLRPLPEAQVWRSKVDGLRVDGWRLLVDTCWAGRLAIANNGDVFVCVGERQTLGNVATVPLRAVVVSKAVRSLWGITLDEVSVCAECEFRYACFDCRAVAHLLSGDLRGRDPTCPYTPATGLWRQKEAPMNTKPKRKENLVLEEIDDELLVADFSDSQLHVLNPTAAAVWEMCDGQRTAEEIADLLAEHFGLSPEQVRQDIAKIIGEFREKGLIE